MKKFLALLAVLFCLSFAIFYNSLADAAGHIGISNVERYLRTRTFTYTAIVSAAADVTPGTDNIVGAVTANAATSFNLTSFSPPPYPCKLSVVLYDGNADDTLATCSFVVTGRNQFGNVVRETISVSETPATTARVYEEVISIVSTSCTTGGDASDYLKATCTPAIGLGLPISSVDAVLSACIVDGGAAVVCMEPGDTGFNATVDLDDDALDFGALATAMSITLADGDQFRIRVRAPAGL